MLRHSGLAAAVAACTVWVGACAEDPAIPACEEPPSVDCTPLYAPEYSEVFETTLQPRCGVGGQSCHGREGARGGLILDDADLAFEMLLQPPSGPPRVVPGDPDCSPLMVRLQSPSDTVVMPPGAPLSESERCAVAAWIRGGAGR